MIFCEEQKQVLGKLNNICKVVTSITLKFVQTLTLFNPYIYAICLL